MSLNILNILHSPHYAGTETAFIGLTRILSRNNRVVCVIPPKSMVKPALGGIAGGGIIEYNRVYRNFGRFDIFAKLKLARIIRKNNIDMVIVHNGRLVDMINSSSIKTTLVAVNHGTNPKKTAQADYAFVVNSRMYDDVAKAGMKKENIFLIPNYIETDAG